MTDTTGDEANKRYYAEGYEDHTTSESEPLFTCSCGGGVYDVIVCKEAGYDRTAMMCDNDECLMAYTPEARDGLATLREGIRLADEWDEARKRYQAGLRSVRPMAMLFGLHNAMQSKAIAYRDWKDAPNVEAEAVAKIKGG